MPDEKAKVKCDEFRINYKGYSIFLRIKHELLD